MQADVTLWNTYEHVHQLAVALTKAQKHGVLIDIDRRNELTKRSEEKKNKIYERIREIAKQDVNINSPKQIKELLYEKMKLPKIYKDGRLTTDENAILTLHKKYPDEEILSLILEYRRVSKLISTFLNVSVDDDHRMRTSYNASGTKSGRISSSQDLFGRGMNLQNIPAGKKPGVENVRDVFIAPKGYSLIKADLSQAETRVVARILCRYADYYLYNRYQEGFDIHKWAASTIFGVKEEDVTKFQRNVGKIANHSGNYCSGPKVIQSTAMKWGIDGISYQMAKQIVETRRKVLPGLVRWWKDVERQLARTRTMWTCLGRRRVFFGRVGDNSVIRDAVSFEPQSTVGDVCNIVFRRLWARKEATDAPWTPILQVHDEVVVETPDALIDDVIKEIRAAAFVPLDLNADLEPLVIPIDIAVGKDWKNCKEI